MGFLGPSLVCQALSWELGLSGDPQGAPHLHGIQTLTVPTVWPVVQQEQGGQVSTQPGPRGGVQKLPQVEVCTAEEVRQKAGEQVKTRAPPPSPLHSSPQLPGGDLSQNRRGR